VKVSPALYKNFYTNALLNTYRRKFCESYLGKEFFRNRSKALKIQFPALKILRNVGKSKRRLILNNNEKITRLEPTLL